VTLARRCCAGAIRGDASPGAVRLREETTLWQTLAERWGAQVVPVWDRGFAGQPWISAALAHRVRFIVRWKKGNKLVNAHGELKKA